VRIYLKEGGKMEEKRLREVFTEEELEKRRQLLKTREERRDVGFCFWIVIFFSGIVASILLNLPKLIGNLVGISTLGKYPLNAFVIIWAWIIWAVLLRQLIQWVLWQFFEKKEDWEEEIIDPALRRRFR